MPVPQPAIGPFPSPERSRQELADLVLTATTTFIAQAALAWVEMAAAGGGGGSSAATNRGAGGASAGQSFIGLRRFIVGKRYTYTKGAKGLGPPPGTSTDTNGNKDGTAAGDSILSGPGQYLRLKGGIGGGDGTVESAAVGFPLDAPAITVSALGGTTYPGTKGGKSNVGAVGDDGGASDIQFPARAGVGAPSGGAGGGTPFGPGGPGGSSTAAGGAPPVADSGAGAGGSGAGDSVHGPGAANGADGRCNIWWQA